MPPKQNRRALKAQKASLAAQSTALLASDLHDGLPVAEQSLCDLFNSTFRELITSRDLIERIQKVKGALFERDYARAFGERENLEAYVVRWSPSRALAYRWVFGRLLRQELRGVLGPGRGERREVVCIGAGAGGEVVGLAGAVADLSKRMEEGAGTEEEGEPERVKVVAIDNASWGPIFEKLSAGISDPKPFGTPPRPTFQLPQSPIFEPTFLHADVLSPDFPASAITTNTSLITLLFTTNELYKQSMSRASAFLLSLRQRTAPGCLLLVLESAGSYSTIRMTVKGEEKEYPMGSFLDFTMVGRGESGWEKVWETDSEWYRLPEGLKYPVELENMRFLVRLYRRVDQS